MWFFREAFPKRFKPSTLRDRNTALKITKNCQLWSRNARQIFLRILQRKQGNWGSKCFSLLLVGPNRRPIGCTKKSPCWRIYPELALLHSEVVLPERELGWTRVLAVEGRDNVAAVRAHVRFTRTRNTVHQLLPLRTQQQSTNLYTPFYTRETIFLIMRFIIKFQ
jgi:hypothetical protein